MGSKYKTTKSHLFRAEFIISNRYGLSAEALNIHQYKKNSKYAAQSNINTINKSLAQFFSFNKPIPLTTKII